MTADDVAARESEVDLAARRNHRDRKGLGDREVGAASADEVTQQLVARLEEQIAASEQQLRARVEQEQRESRRTTPMSFALRGDLKERLNRFRTDGGTINVSGICNDAIEHELDRLGSGGAVAQRLRVESTDRRGPSWTMGYRVGRKWAEEVASWLEITAYATTY